MDNELRQYLETALWSSVGDNGDPLDKNYSTDDIDSESVAKAQVQLKEFINKAGDLLNDLDLTDVAHDFWLTRNRHGVGFWDGDYSDEIGKKLTDLSHEFGEVDLYIGDDGMLHFS